MLKRKIIVIGGSAAGPAAAAKAKRVNPEHEVVMYEAGEYISIGTCEIPYVLSGEIDNYEKILFYNPESYESEKKVRVKNFHRVESIDRIKKRIFVRDTKNNIQFNDNYDKLILCTGSVKRFHPEFPKGLKNVFYLKTVDDLRAIQRFIQEKKITNSVIIGAGLTGLESIAFVSKYSGSVLLIDSNPLPLNGYSEEVQKIVLDKLHSDKIEFFGGVSSVSPKLKNDYVEAIVIDGEVHSVDFVLVTIGFEPNTSLSQASKLSHHKDNAIRVDRKLQTSDDNIFAAGDCISVENFITKKPMWLPLATLSHNFGHVAGANAAGESFYAESVVKNLLLKLSDLSIAHVGLTWKEIKNFGIHCEELSAVGNSRIKIIPNGEKHFVKIFYESRTKKIIGADLIGGEDIIGKANLLSFAIKNNITMNKLNAVDYAYTPVLSTFIETLSIMGRKAGTD